MKISLLIIVLFFLGCLNNYNQNANISLASKMKQSKKVMLFVNLSLFQILNQTNNQYFKILK
ncbi:hypothetical protein FLAVO9AF_760008 [Flavobacterium sp. 9AF]|nr:hypothetical protein FLAVO9AF_760008 [Flavobacterium sp. 9AF]